MPLQDSETLRASAKETEIDEQDDSLSEKQDFLTTEHPTIIQNQTLKDNKQRFEQKDQHTETKIKENTKVNNYNTNFGSFSNGYVFFNAERYNDTQGFVMAFYTIKMIFMIQYIFCILSNILGFCYPK